MPERTSIRRSVLTAVFILVLAVPAMAEDEFGQSQAAQQKCLCFRGGPQSQCRSFLVTDFGFRLYTNRYRFEDYDAGAITIELGWMKNLKRGYAVGVTAYQAIDGRTYRLGVRPHVRRWLGRKMSMDFSLGVLVYSNEGEFFNWGDNPPKYDGNGPGVIASLNFCVLDLFAATAQYERFGVAYGPYAWAGQTSPRVNFQQNIFSVGLTGQSYIGSGVIGLIILAAALD